MATDSRYFFNFYLSRSSFPRGIASTKMLYFKFLKSFLCCFDHYNQSTAGGAVMCSLVLEVEISFEFILLLLALPSSLLLVMSPNFNPCP